MQQNVSVIDVALLQARIAALEAELALYAFRYGLTHEARRLLARRLQDGRDSISDS